MNYSATVVPGFSWSYSVLKNSETCQLRYYHYNVAKDVKEPETDQMREGTNLHKHFENRVRHSTPLPLGYGQYEPMLAKAIAAPGETHAEKKLALTAEFQPIAYFGGQQVWFRTVIDFTKVRETSATVLDWKTGKPSADLTQLQLMAVTLFAFMPAVQRVKAGLVFVGHGQVEPAEFVRSDVTEIWGEILPRVAKVAKARATNEYPPKPSGLCKKYCAVVSCPYHGRGA